MSVNKAILVGRLALIQKHGLHSGGQGVANHSWPPTKATRTRTANARSTPNGTKSSTGGSKPKSRSNI